MRLEIGCNDFLLFSPSSSPLFIGHYSQERQEDADGQDDPFMGQYFVSQVHGVSLHTILLLFFEGYYATPMPI
jgi:hypothetical protein